MRALPNWFGIDESIVEYVDDLKTLDGIVAKRNGQVVGFIGLKQYGDYAIEINVMGVHPNNRNQGIGTLLVKYIENHIASAKTKLLHVKTLGPTHPDPHYAETRKFYEAKGFIPMEENDLWGDVNPCLVMVKPLMPK